MTLTHCIVAAAFRGLTSLLFRIDDAQLARVPERGPLIIVANSSGFSSVWTLGFGEACGAC